MIKGLTENYKVDHIKQSLEDEISADVDNSNESILSISLYQRIAGETDDRGRFLRLLADCKTQGKKAKLEAFKIYKIASYDTDSNIALTIDLSYINLEGSSATLDFTGNPAQTSIYVTATKVPPYFNNHVGQIKNLFIDGKSSGTARNNSTALRIDSSVNGSGVAHVDLNKINIRGFAVGIKYCNHAYLIRHTSVDIFDCDTCLLMPSGYSDYGEGISFYGCTFYNAGTAVNIQNPSGEFHFFGCSFDYNSLEFDINSSVAMLSQCHIEGSCRIKVSGNGGTLQINNSRFIFQNTSAYAPFNVSTDCEGIYIKDSYIDGGLFNTVGKYDIVTNGGKVKIEGSKSYNIYTGFFTNYLNENSLNFSPKHLDAEVFSYTDNEIYNTLSAKNINITRDTTVFESGTFSTKITKQFGSYSSSGCYLFVKLQPNTKRVSYRLRWKSNINIPTNTIDFYILWADCLRGKKIVTTTTINKTGTGGTDKHTHTYGKDIYLTDFAKTQDLGHIGQWVSLNNTWSSFDPGAIQSTRPSWANYFVIALGLDLLAGPGNIYIDKLEVYEF